ncbi:MAG: RluA family pseudouridine synthase [Flavobacteriales bacterium]|nr:RluA family pseudouridine synthase [Flavobacteriales bacterium]
MTDKSSAENPLSEAQDDLFEHYRFEVDPGQQPLRVDKFLVDRLPQTSRNKIQNAAAASCIRCNDKPVKSNYKVKAGDVITLVLPYPPRVIELIPEDIPLDIVYEDDDVVVVNKQAGLVVHPGYGNYSGTLVNALIFHFQNLPKAQIKGYGEEGVEENTDGTRPGLVHRLDKNTTGLMVIAKSELALPKLAAQFYDRTVTRAYVALVWGDVKDEEGTVIGHVGRSLKNRKVMNVFPDGEFGKHAVTHYKVLERFGYVTLIQCRLETGRTHQIRIHMKHIGHPLFNDNEYGGDKILKGLSSNKYNQFIKNCFGLLPRQALHAKTLGFVHPSSGREIQFESEIPADISAVLVKWRTYTSSMNASS